MALTTVPASLSATALTLTTAAQPNITSVGTLTGLTVSGNIAGTLTTAAQPNITSLGTLTGLTVAGALAVSPSSGTAKVTFTSQGAGSEIFSVNGQIPGVNNAGFAIRNETDSRNDFTIDGSGSATFAGSIRAGSVGFRIAADSNYAFVALQNSSLTHGGYMSIQGATATGLEINASASSSFSGTILLAKQSQRTSGGYLARFANSAGDKMVVETGGDVGIGTTSVDARLHVESGTATNILRFGDGGRWGFQRQNSDSRYVSLSRNMNTGSINAVFTVDGDNGNVGIGTTTLNKFFNLADPAQGGEQIKLHFEASSSADKWAIYSYDRTNGHYTDLSFGANYLYLKSGGNVGIGTNNPGHKLDVEGGANQFDLFRVGSSASDNSEVTIGYFDASAGNGIPGLIGASDFGGLIQSGEHGNLVLGIRGNDATDGVAILSGGGNFMSDSTYDTIVAKFRADGKVGIGTNTPESRLHVRKTNVSSKHIDSFAASILEDSESRLQLISADTGDNASAVILTNVNKHWGMHHHGPDGNNTFSIGYHQSSSSGADFVNSLSDVLNITTGGAVGIGMVGAQALDIDRTTGLSLRFYNSGTFKAGMQAVDTGGQMVASSSANDFAIRSQSNILFSTGGNTERMKIDTSGNVGIDETPGTSTSKLAVGGAIYQDPGSWAYGNLLRRLSISGPSGSGTFTRTIDITTQLKFAAHGGAFMYMLHGWMADRAHGMVSWRNPGDGSQVISDVYQDVYTATGITVTASKGSGNLEIDLDISSAHSNAHGWYFVLWW